MFCTLERGNRNLLPERLRASILVQVEENSIDNRYTNSKWSARKRPTIFFRALCVFAVIGFVFYVGWNLFWACQAQVPPSIFTYVTGLPCPTTGGTRSVGCLVRGELAESLRYNAMTIPIAILFFATLFELGLNYRRQSKLRVRTFYLPLWGGILLVAWALKLFGDPAYW